MYLNTLEVSPTISLLTYSILCWIGRCPIGLSCPLGSPAPRQDYPVVRVFVSFLCVVESMTFLWMFAKFGHREKDGDRQTVGASSLDLWFWNPVWIIRTVNIVAWWRIKTKEKEWLTLPVLTTTLQWKQTSQHTVTLSTEWRICPHLWMCHTPLQSAQVSFGTWVRAWPNVTKNTSFLTEIQNRITDSQHVCP